MYTLTLILSWHLAGAVAEFDNHPMFIDTMGGQVHLTGFPTKAACQAYVYKPPIVLNGLQQAYTVTSRTCWFAATKPASSQALDEAAVGNGTTG